MDSYMGSSKLLVSNKHEKSSSEDDFYDSRTNYSDYHIYNNNNDNHNNANSSPSGSGSGGGGGVNTESNKKGKITHSEVEKRRREKMNKYLFELTPYLPINPNSNKKLDKISILRLAVQHMKNIKNTTQHLSESIIQQSLITDNELQTLAIDSADGLLLAIKCETSKIIYASSSCLKTINYLPTDLIDKVFFEIVHPADNRYVKDQLMYSDFGATSSSSNNYDGKALNNLTGSRRSFTCRIIKGPAIVPLSPSMSTTQQSSPSFSIHHHYQQQQQQQEQHLNSKVNNYIHQTSRSENEYQIIHFIGYIKCDNVKTSSSFQTTASSTSDVYLDHYQNHNLNRTNSLNNNKNNIFVLYGHIKDQLNSSISEFVSRHDVDSHFIFVEPNVYSILGYLSHEMLTNCFKDYVHPDDYGSLKNTFLEAIKRKQKLKSEPYRFRMKNCEYVIVESLFQALWNPFNNKIEYVVSYNKRYPISPSASSSTSSTPLTITPVSSTTSNSTLTSPTTPTTTPSLLTSSMQSMHEIFINNNSANQNINNIENANNMHQIPTSHHLMNQEVQQHQHPHHHHHQNRFHPYNNSQYHHNHHHNHNVSPRSKYNS